MTATRNLMRAVPALFLAILFAGCGDDDPTGPTLDLAAVVERCARGTIESVPETGETVTGRLDSGDCRPVVEGQASGRIEGWRVPQTAFGAVDQIAVLLDAEFDGVLVVLGPEGQVLWYEDNDQGGDLGVEGLILGRDFDPSQPTYFIGVYAYEEQEEGYTVPGDYTLRFVQSP